ncbi:DUF2278 family protein [Mesorhizobium sp. WSM3859]|uniref:DUF2278 family protein n=1 Tax=Mesorhizobium sp. WSM3859 TaxID=2029402 RepID=UPI000BAF26E9|nr:DUF2278 family protein [Mesorhizobium sp. WSM3859]PBC09269.1 hypothetical protein CK230_17465 [Mesorhizobium sp. WSM3859]
MGLAHGYGFVIGTKSDYWRDPVDNFGRYMHGNMKVHTPNGEYRCAIDVDSQVSPVHWRIQPLRVNEWTPLLSLQDGWHSLQSEAGSGAVDYIRDTRLRDVFVIPQIVDLEPRWPPIPPEELVGRDLLHQVALEGRQPVIAKAKLRGAKSLKKLRPVKRITLQSRKLELWMNIAPWNSGTSLQALVDLEAVLAGAQRVMVFGEPFHDGTLGVHNIHQNQGDPPGPHAGENATWQDGITIAFKQDGTASAFMNKFGTQSDRTDDQGKPLP